MCSRVVEAGRRWWGGGLGGSRNGFKFGTFIWPFFPSDGAASVAVKRLILRFGSFWHGWHLNIVLLSLLLLHRFFFFFFFFNTAITVKTILNIHCLLFRVVVFLFCFLVFCCCCFLGGFWYFFLVFFLGFSVWFFFPFFFWGYFFLFFVLFLFWYFRRINRQ